MPTTAVILLVISAATHAGWNFLGSGRKSSLWLYAAAEGAMAAATIPWWPWAFAFLRGQNGRFFCLLAVSCLCQALYYAALAAAYRREGMTVVYPAVRALPVAGMALLAGSLGWRPMGWFAGLGITCVLIGCVGPPCVAAWRTRHSAVAASAGGAGARGAVLLAAAASLVYALIDAHLVSNAYAQAGPGGIVAVAIAICCGNAVGCTVLASIQGGESARSALCGRAGEAVLCGIGAWLSYGTYLAAVAMVDNPSHAAALRQCSVPLGVGLALALRGERPGRGRTVAIATVIVGSLMVVTAPR